MKTIIIILITILTLIRVKSFKHKILTNAERIKIDTLRKSGTWGGVMLGLAEMNLMTQGPVDVILKGIQEVLTDLAKKH